MSNAKHNHTHDEHNHVHDEQNHVHDEHMHTHDGVHYHSHESEHEHGHHTEHGHTHDPKEMKKIINRISRAIGHLNSVKGMMEDGKDCADVLIQLAAVRSEINNAGKALLKEHLDHCIVEAVAENDQEAILHMNKAIDQFMK
jgi:DNA-binding FrmR family transcriptional regulator